MVQLFANRYLMFPDQYVVGQRRSLLWPVYVWRVLYPDAAPMGANIFQQTVLALSRAKLVDSVEIANLLGLSPELVARVISELQEQKWVDKKGYITAIGMSFLENHESMTGKQKVGYAFQDAISGDMLPRFAENLPEIEPVSVGDGFPEFRLDRAKGKIESDSPFCVTTSQNTPRPFNNHDLLESYKRYRTDYFNARLLDDDQDPPQGINLNNIDCIDPVSTAMYVWCWIYRDEGSDKAWLCSDPFGLRKASPWMRDHVERAAVTLPSLSKRLSGLLGLPLDTQLTIETLDTIDEKVHWDIIAEYPWASKVGQYARYLPAFLRQRMLVESRDNPTDEQLDSLLSEAQKLAEGSIQWMLERWPGGIEAEKLPRDWQRSEALNTLLSLNLDAINENVAAKLAGQKVWSIKKSLRSRSESLKSLLFAALITTHSHPDHPLRLANISSVNLEGLISLAESRNKAGHASGRKFEKEYAIEQGNLAMQWINKFEEYY